MRAAIILLGSAVLAGCAPADRQPQSGDEAVPAADRPAPVDILEAAASYPDRVTSYRDSTGRMVPAKYGDPDLDRAAEALSDIERPWTVEKILGKFESETESCRRAHLIRVLAASRDPRAALLLHGLLDDPSLDIRMAALRGLWDHHVRYEGAWSGGTEQMFEDEAKWWEKNEDQLRSAARAIAEAAYAPEPAAGPASDGESSRPAR